MPTVARLDERERKVGDISVDRNSDSSTGNLRDLLRLNIAVAIPCVVEDASATLERWPERARSSVG